MPAVSQAQREYLNATKGHAWVKRHHFDNKGKLPEHAKKRKKKPTKKQHAQAEAIKKMGSKS